MTERELPPLHNTPPPIFSTSFEKEPAAAAAAAAGFVIEPTFQAFWHPIRRQVKGQQQCTNKNALVLTPISMATLFLSFPSDIVVKSCEKRSSPDWINSHRGSRGGCWRVSISLCNKIYSSSIFIFLFSLLNITRTYVQLKASNCTID